MDIKRFCISLCVPLALAVAAGCSVKEERGGCPCYLTVTFDGSAQVMDSEGITSLKLDVRMTDADQDCGSVSCEELDRMHEYKVRKGLATVSAYGTLTNMREKDGAIIVPTGMEADRIFCHAHTVDCTGEEAFDDVKLHKQYCTLTVVLTGGVYWKPYYLRVLSGWVGCDRYSFSAVEGRFDCPMTQTGTDTYTIRIPRQGDDGLRLEMYGLTTYGTMDDYVESFDIGRIIAANGFDWSDVDLADVSVTIDYAKTEYTVSILPWQGGLSGEIVI